VAMRIRMKLHTGSPMANPDSYVHSLRPAHRMGSSAQSLVRTARITTPPPAWLPSPTKAITRRTQRTDGRVFYDSHVQSLKSTDLSVRNFVNQVLAEIAVTPGNNFKPKRDRGS